jgi:hypothetical protein
MWRRDFMTFVGGVAGRMQRKFTMNLESGKLVITA